MCRRANVSACADITGHKNLCDRGSSRPALGIRVRGSEVAKDVINASHSMEYIASSADPTSFPKHTGRSQRDARSSIASTFCHFKLETRIRVDRRAPSEPAAPTYHSMPVVAFLAAASEELTHRSRNAQDAGSKGASPRSRICRRIAAAVYGRAPVPTQTARRTAASGASLSCFQSSEAAEAGVLEAGSLGAFGRQTDRGAWQVQRAGRCGTDCCSLTTALQAARSLAVRRNYKDGTGCRCAAQAMR